MAGNRNHVDAAITGKAKPNSWRLIGFTVET